MTGSNLVLFVAALLILIAALALGRRVGRRGVQPAATTGMPPGPGAPPDIAAEVMDYLRRIEAQGSPGLVADVIQTFLLDTAARLATLRHAVAERDGDTVYRVAHALQGSAAMVGAQSVARGCAALTRSARSGSFDQCEAAVAELNVRFEAIQRTMTAADGRVAVPPWTPQ